MNAISPETGAVFLFYLAAMTGIGIFYWRKTASVSEYILGNRDLGWFVTALSAEASDMSGWLLIGLPGLAYACGLQAGWVALGLIAGTFLNWKFIAPALRLYSHQAGDALTIPEFFRNRFHDSSDQVGIVCAVFILIFFVIYTSAQFVAGGKLFETVFGIDYRIAILIGSGIVIAYTVTGGFRAVCVTDTIQGIMMFFAILIVPITGIILIGGPCAAISAVMHDNPYLLNPFVGPDGTPLTFIAIISLLAWGLGYFGQPHILIRFMAIRKPEEIRNARLVATAWVCLTLGAAVTVGLVGRAVLTQPLPGTASETVFMVMTLDLLPSLLAGIVLCGILAAIMSTASSILLVTASALSEDVYLPLIRPRASELELLWVSRIAVLIIAGLALLLALNPESFVFSLVAYAWAGFGAAFGPAVLASLFWRRTTRNGILAGIIVGGLTVLVWKQFAFFDLYEILPGFFLSMAAIWIVSQRTPEPAPAITREFDQVRGETRRLG